MRIIRLLFLIIWALIFISEASAQNKSWVIPSPDKKINFKVFEKADRLYYQVGFPDTLIICESPLGIARSDEQFIEKLSFISASKPRHISENYTMQVGKQLKCTYQANELILSFENDHKAKVDLLLRASNEGIAFRYRFPETGTGGYEVTKEVSGFNMSKSLRTWIQPYDSITRYSPGYERYYTNGSPVGETSPEYGGWCLGALFQASNGWVLLTEADLDGTYCGSRLHQNASGGVYSISYPDYTEAMKIGNNNPESSSVPWMTPWRVAIIGKDAAFIATSTMVNGLSKSSKITDVSWIKPGLAYWSWWADPASPKVYKSMLPYIDLAAEWGIPYFLVDANWTKMEGGNIEQLIAYAKQKGVGIWMWYNSGGPHNTVLGAPRNRMWDSDQRRKEFEKLKKWGVKGVKVDFFQSDKQHIIQQYMDILQDAADFQVMVNFHGCTLPRGWQRTWPNLISMEAIAGEECYMFRESYPEAAVWHNTIQPFTRNALGSMDYTPFGLTEKINKHLTTYAYELALTVVFESGIVHLIDFPNVYKALPDYVQAFVKQLPTVWDETKMVYGYPGRDVVMARRSGDKWFIGGINGEKKNKEINLNFDFLKSGRNYTAKLITDGDNDKSFNYKEIYVKKSDKLPVMMLPCGGFTIVMKE
ncbi:MAG: glycoside hydrolase family 97 catalytic domain-containing protein [Mariniphaga sp.]